MELINYAKSNNKGLVLSCFCHIDCRFCSRLYWAGLGIWDTRVVVAVALGVFLAWKSMYRQEAPVGSPVTKVAQVVVAAVKKWRLSHENGFHLCLEAGESSQAMTRNLARTNQFRFLDKATFVDEIDMSSDKKNSCRLANVNQVEQVKLLFRLIPLWVILLDVHCRHSPAPHFIHKTRQHLKSHHRVHQEIQVGMGPAGELRYPSYPEKDGVWRFPGIGAFQCYDKYMLSSLKAAAENYGKPEWGSIGPTDAGEYNNWPEDTNFFKKENGGWNSEYGDFFLTWYSQMSLDHGERILSSTNSIFENQGVKISVKVAGIHWHYGTRSHAPELTAGYYNTRYRDGYLPISRMVARHGAVFNFTCIEMRDHEQPQDAQCAPEKLVQQVTLATQEAQVPLAYVYR